VWADGMTAPPDRAVRPVSDNPDARWAVGIGCQQK
jgi:hypothetical protein